MTWDLLNLAVAAIAFILVVMYARRAWDSGDRVWMGLAWMWGFVACINVFSGLT